MLKIKKRNSIIVFDFGSQYTRLIAKRIREMGVVCNICLYNVDINFLKSLFPCGIILSGGPYSVNSISHIKVPKYLFDLEIPILGICYGMQIMVAQLGGKICSVNKLESGHTEVFLSKNSNSLLENIYDRKNSKNIRVLDVWMSHKDHIVTLPKNFDIICSTSNRVIAGIANEKKFWYGLQFHPEVTQTLQGVKILERFVIDICSANVCFMKTNIIDKIIFDIKGKVKNDKVLLALSGGLDSLVVAKLLFMAIKNNLICIFINTGLLDYNFIRRIIDDFTKDTGINVIRINAEDKFLNALSGIVSPEKKRKIIGSVFAKIFIDNARKFSDINWLAQGTIYSDVIESSLINDFNDFSFKIKTHHNVGGLPPNFNLNLIEPIRDLFKDEVKDIALKLGLSCDIVYNHPFPGPGFSIRIVGEVKRRYINILKKSDEIYIRELKRYDLYHKVDQAFSIFLPIKTVGIIGDNRLYEYVICLRAIKSMDFMTARIVKLPWDFLENVSNKIINEVEEVSRVVYDISGKPPSTIEWE
ncbi:glutamine-hydrolyzing GMP synthase [Candidatus Legionella polyplacis]|uniref:GMP synthase [glutamine-hydrolyzing] n=1 Tax=Candidatus Legionella polyplacis TaxID=2005262 RepID=A0ABZ2H142_9GAMM